MLESETEREREGSQMGCHRNRHVQGPCLRAKDEGMIMLVSVCCLFLSLSSHFTSTELLYLHDNSSERILTKQRRRAHTQWFMLSNIIRWLITCLALQKRQYLLFSFFLFITSDHFCHHPSTSFSFSLFLFLPILPPSFCLQAVLH